MTPVLNQAGLSDLLERWSDQGWLRAIDTAFAAFLLRESPDAHPLLILAAALASHQLGRGHACLDLAGTIKDPELALSLPPEGAAGEGEAPPLPSQVLSSLTVEAWLAALANPDLVGTGPGNTPLVLAGQRLYLRRYWQYEESVRLWVESRLATPIPLPQARLKAALDGLFPPGAAGPDWQKLACALSARSAFSVITGGPGTGKTTTVVRLLALLQALALDAGQPLRIRLAAPTGKAAARLNESISGAVAKLKLDALGDGEALRAAIPVAVTTLHRLLGSRPDTRHFRYNAGNRLPLDLLVVDEASMMDLEMMAALLEALPDPARLVLLGDKDQLASVEAGAVLGVLCARALEGHYTSATAAWLKEVTSDALAPELIDPAGGLLDQAVAMLRFSHRFGEKSGIGQLAAAVNAGDAGAVRHVFAAGHTELGRIPAAEQELKALVIDGAKPGAHGYRHYLETISNTRPVPGASQQALDGWASEVLAAHSEFQLLCALRRGPWGVEGLNASIAGWLHQESLIAEVEGWYAGRPVLVTRNDYGLGLMNGDIGITLALPSKQGEVLRVAFPAEGGGIRWVQPSRLQAVETVYALTVHKSQGSEFAHVALVLPEHINPILTRELVYTGITRARKFFTLAEAGGDGVLGGAIARQVLRASGLVFQAPGRCHQNETIECEHREFSQTSLFE
ncbi:exodeoxyribonuclease V subunit alpha [Niveibacterium terrae]|uniref:exodeoxyribonuclease V subunit alpha n=1 Tax=Niveibacterium terrae TaxID=3373598 RepID=UPI003A957EEF